MNRILFPIVFAAYASLAHAWEDIVLTPPAGKSGPVSVVYFAQGADITTNQYVNIMTSLQKAVDFPLWVGIPQCPFNVAAIPGGLKSGIDRITTTMVNQGMKAQFKFYAGHSLGGAMMPDYVNTEVPTTANGMFLFGAFLTRSFKTGHTSSGRPQVQFPVPSLTVGGELDGLARLSRIVEALYSQVTFSENPSKATLFMPVTIVGGMNHMQFASGEAPSFVKKNDLQSDVTEEVAHSAVVSDVAAFLGSLVYPTQSKYASTLKTRVQQSTTFAQPLVDALLVESYEEFLPPCYCEAKDEYGTTTFATCASTPACTGGAGWTDRYAQPIIAGIGSSSAVSGLKISSVDTMQKTSSNHEAHIHGGKDRKSSQNPGDGQTPPLCSAPSKCTLDVTTVTEHTYDQNAADSISNWLDTGFAPITAFEMKTKMKSRQAVWQAAGLVNTSFSEDALDKNLCAAVQRAAVDYASSRVSATTRKRFEKYGQKFVIGSDVNGSPTWEMAAMKWAEDNAANTVKVQAVAYSTENKGTKTNAGAHYCKLLSPARVMEWMYTDGLRNKLGLDKV